MITKSVDARVVGRADALEGQNARVRLSVLVTVSERPAPLYDLYREYAPVIAEACGSYEFIFAMEPAFEAQAERLRSLMNSGEPIRVLVAGQALGETALLNLAADHARADLLLTLPGYHRVAAAAVPPLIRRAEEGVDLVVARRWPRRDSLINRLQNRSFHALLRRVVGGSVKDVACGVMAMRTDLLRQIPLYGDFARFLPLLVARDGFKVVEVDAQQHPKDRSPRIYGPGIYLRRLLDVFGLFFLLRFTEKPLRFFGLLGSGLSVLGLVALMVLGIQRLQGQGIADRPMLLLGVLLLVLGVQAIALGLIGEIIVHLNAPRRRPYRIAGNP